MRRRVILVTLVVALFAVPGSAWAYHHLSWFTPDGQAIRSEVVDATRASHLFDNPPARYHRGAVPQHVLQSERSRAASLSGRLYTRRILTPMLAVYQRQISDQARRLPVNVGWVTTDVQPTDLSLLPQSASATVRSTYTSTLGQVSVWDEQFRLVRTSQGWRIDAWTGDCVSGCP
jgi:hypothetical protein